jgi:hypothetical protein
MNTFEIGDFIFRDNKLFIVNSKTPNGAVLFDIALDIIITCNNLKDFTVNNLFNPLSRFLIFNYLKALKESGCYSDLETICEQLKINGENI